MQNVSLPEIHHAITVFVKYFNKFIKLTFCDA